LEAHKAEVEDMLFDEWNLEDALVIEREEGREEGMERGREEGMERGIEVGIATVARTALAEGMSFDIICKLTGLDRAAIEHLSAEAGK
jgi:predicted transposase/invertase (TIGR01784 family)